MREARVPVSPTLEASVAVAHDYLTQLGGAERVAGVIAREFPEAKLMTSVHDRQAAPLRFVGGRPWRTSFLQPLAGRFNLKLLLPLLPAAMASLPARGSDLVISSSSAFGHHVRKSAGAVHVCFCHTPPRFLWRPDDYFRGRKALRLALSPLLAVLRRLDRAAASRVDCYIAVSRHIASRIHEVYGREAIVVHSPVDTSRFSPRRTRSGRFLVVSRLVRSKRVDLVIGAANRYELPLDVIGTGPELAALRRLAGPSVRLLGWQPDTLVREAMAEAEAVVVAGEEDFGLVTVEAQASGTPPVAFAGGGTLEIVEDGTTGFLFRDQTPEAIAEAMLRAAERRLDAASLVESARRFDVAVFKERFHAAVAAARRQSQTAGRPAERLAPAK